MLNDPYIIATVKSKRINWEGHIWRRRKHLVELVTKWILESKMFKITMDGLNSKRTYR